MGCETWLFFKVDWYREVELDPRFSNLPRIKNQGVHDMYRWREKGAWIAAKRVDAQVFLSSDSTEEGRRFQHLHFKRSSSYVIPEHYYRPSIDGDW
jgi:hypothetical protein